MRRVFVEGLARGFHPNVVVTARAALERITYLEAVLRGIAMSEPSPDIMRQAREALGRQL